MATTNPAAVSSKGKVVQYSIESTFNTDPDANYTDIRVEGEPTVAAPAETGVPVNTLQSNVYDGESPITTSQFVDGAFVIPTIIRAPATPGEDSFTVTALKSGGFQVASSDDTTTTGTPTVSAIDMTDATNVLTGEGCHILLPSGKYFPVLSADTTAGTITPSMQLPEAPGVGAAILGADTASPGTPGPTSTTLSIRHWNQMKASGGSNFVYHQGTGCALESAGDLVMERGTHPVMEMTFRAAQLTRGNNATFPTNSFQDGTGIQVWDDLLVGFAGSATAGDIAASYYSVIKATLSLGVNTSVVPELAGQNDQGGICEHMSTPTDTMPRLTLEIKADEARYDDWETPGGVSKYIALTQYGTAAAPGFGIFCPTARLIEQPVDEPYGQDFEKFTLVYQLYPAGYTAGSAAIQGNQPYYLVLPSDRA
jgi:hypothetical protein